MRAAPGQRVRTLRGAQRGVVLIVLMVALVLGASAYFVSALNAASNSADITRRMNSSKALAEAKQALLAYVATLATSDANPGRFPCPEAPGYATNADPDDDGVAQGGTCTLPAVGRLPWRTLGISKLTDGYGEPLWYALSPGFASAPGLSINSDTPAQLTADGTPVVALVIAPGPPMNVAAAPGCAARVQRRNFPLSLDLRDYLECENASSPADTVFVSNGPAGSFNDQAVTITRGELWNAVEPVVAKRIETQIAPVLRTVYAGGNWSLAGTNVYPYAVEFSDPSTSTFLPTTDETAGLLPLFTSATDPTRVVWYRASETYPPSVSKLSGTGTLDSFNCSATGTSTVTCNVAYSGDVRIEVQAAARRVARTMRQLNPAAIPLPPAPGAWADPVNPSLAVSAGFIPSSTSGAAYVYVRANLPPGGGTATVTVPIGVLADHPLTDPNDATTGWFVGNNWHHLTYYAFAPSYASNHTHYCNAAPGTEPCLTVGNLAPAGRQRSILILAGRALGTQARPSATLSDYLEDPLNLDADYSLFARQPVSKTLNDRIVVVDSNP